MFFVTELLRVENEEILRNKIATLKRSEKAMKEELKKKDKVIQEKEKIIEEKESSQRKKDQEIARLKELESTKKKL